MRCESAIAEITEALNDLSTIRSGPSACSGYIDDMARANQHCRTAIEILHALEPENKSLEVLFFGYYTSPGHYLRSKAGVVVIGCIPWGSSIDTGLLISRQDKYARPITEPTENYTVARKEGWTAISFWDRSGDSRPGSNSAFLVAADVSDKELLTLARKQWPEIFARPGFPLK
jgi:hypothetical protein